MKVFLRINAQGKYDIKIKAKQDPNKNVWMLSHMIAQLARFGMLDLKIEGEEKTPVLLAKSIGEEIGRAMKDKLNRKKGHSLFLWPFEQSLEIVFIEQSLTRKHYVIVKSDTSSEEERKILENFYRGLASKAKINILVYTIDSQRFSQKGLGMMYNTHHQFEGAGKALGRVMRELTEQKTAKLVLQTKGKLQRKSLETDVETLWELRGAKRSKINIRAERDPNKNIKILKNGLEAFTKAGNFNLSLKAWGDDEHHLYEDLSIVLGNLFNKLLRERKGIMRTAWSIHSLKGGIVVLALDLGRGYCHIETDIKNLSIRAMVHHFFETFSRFAKIDVVAFGIQGKHPFVSHIKPVLEKVLQKSELNIVTRSVKKLSDEELSKVLFRGLGKALGEAIKIDPKRGEEIPSTKGVLD